jgi:hypothetical protein
MSVVRFSPAVVLTLRNLVENLDFEVSGQIEVNQEGVADILGLYLVGNSHQTHSPQGQFTFHTHPLSLSQEGKTKNRGPTNGDCLDDVNRQHKGWQHPGDVSFICSPEGVYAMRVLPDPIMSKLQDMPKDLHPQELKEIFLEWYYDTADAVSIYNGGPRLLEEMRKLRKSPVPAEQAYATQMMERHKEHAGDRRQFLDDMRTFGFDIEFQPWGRAMVFHAEFRSSNELLCWTPDVLPVIEEDRLSNGLT